MPENKLVKWVKSFRSGESKSAPEYGQNYLAADKWASSMWKFTGWNWFSRGTANTEQYQREIGPLDGNSLVMCVVNYTGTRLPEAKPTVIRNLPDGNTVHEPNHKLAKLIRHPNQFSIWANYCLALSLSWWIDGNVYFLKDRNQYTGEVLQLWYIPHFLMRPRWYGDGMSPAVPQFDEQGNESNKIISHYQYDVPGKVAVLYPANDIVHIKRGVNLGNPRKGLSAFEPLITELYGDNKMALFTAQLMKNMGLQVPVFSAKDKNTEISETQAMQMKADWMAKTTGERVGEPVFMSIPLDMEKYGFSPTELDLSKLRMIPESRVAAVTGIPAATLQLMVGLINGTSYASSAQARQQGYEEVVIPILQTIEEEIAWQLMYEFEKNIETVIFEFDTAKVRVLQDDANDAMKRAATGYLGGILMRSDARKIVMLETTIDDDVFFDPRGGSLVKEGEDPNAVTGTNAGTLPAKGFGSVADIEKYLGYLEKEMADFQTKKK